MKTSLPTPLGAATDVGEARIAPRGVLATATLSRSGDGIAYEARLVHRAMSDLAGSESRVIELGVSGAEPVALRARVRFFTTLLRLQSLHRANWVVTSGRSSPLRNPNPPTASFAGYAPHIPRLRRSSMRSAN